MADIRQGTVGSLRNANRLRVIETIRENPGISAAETAERTGLSRATITTLVAELERSRVIRKKGSAGSGPRGGRPPALLELGESAGATVGVDIGHYGIRCLVAEPNGEILRPKPHETSGINVDTDPYATFSRAAKLVDEALREAGKVPGEVGGIGVGIPGPVNRATGMVMSTDFLQWPRTPIADEMRRHLFNRLGVNLNVVVDNDANLGGLGEMRRGVGSKSANLIFIKASRGIGAGLILDGHVYRGVTGAAGEFGHISVTDLVSGEADEARDSEVRNGDDYYCDRCGQFGCLEAVASGAAIEARLKKHHSDLYPPEVSFVDVIAGVAKGEDHPLCLAEIQRAGRYVGAAVAGLVHLLDPEHVIIGGPLSQSDEFLKQIHREVSWRAPRGIGDNVVIKPVVNWRLSGVHGAIELAMDEIPQQANRS